MSKNQKKFWSTVAAVMTGIGTFIAAIPPLVNMFKPETQIQQTKSTPLPSPEISVKSTPKPGVRFFCGTGEYRGRNVPATIVENPELNEEIIVILWKLDNDYFGEKYPPQKRCKIVSERFQNIYDKGGLKYIVPTLESWVPNQEIPVVCGVKQMMSSCNNEDLLFTLESKDDPNLVVKDLINSLEISKKNPPILRGEEPPNTFAEGKRVYYDFSGVLNRWQLEENYQEKPAF